MKKCIMVGVLCAILCGVSSVTLFAEFDRPGSDMTFEGYARDIIHQLAQKKYNEAISSFDVQLRETLSLNKLRQTWSYLLQHAGNFRETSTVQRVKESGVETVYVTCVFEYAVIDAKFIFDEFKKVHSLTFVPSRPAVVKK